MSCVTTKKLLCRNKSVTDMMESIAMMKGVLKQKLNTADCQIGGRSWWVFSPAQIHNNEALPKWKAPRYYERKR